MIAEEQLRNIESSSFCKLDDKDKRRIYAKYMSIVDQDYNSNQVTKSMAKLDSLKGKFGYKGKR